MGPTADDHGVEFEPWRRRNSYFHCKCGHFRVIIAIIAAAAQIHGPKTHELCSFSRQGWQTRNLKVHNKAKKSKNLNFWQPLMLFSLAQWTGIG